MQRIKKGLFPDISPLSVLGRPDKAIITWMQTFAKVSGEYLAEMVLVNKKGKFLVDHAWVI